MKYYVSLSWTKSSPSSSQPLTMRLLSGPIAKWTMPVWCLVFISLILSDSYNLWWFRWPATGALGRRLHQRQNTNRRQIIRHLALPYHHDGLHWRLDSWTIEEKKDHRYKSRLKGTCTSLNRSNCHQRMSRRKNLFLPIFSFFSLRSHRYWNNL